MSLRHVLTGVGAALLLATPASAGGSFEQVVAVGAHGSSRTIRLRQSGRRSEAALSGPAAAAPRGGFLRLYPLIGGLPAVPGRYYPASEVLCLSGDAAASGCVKLSDAGVTLLSPFARLPLRHQVPTVPVEVRYDSRPLRYADGNVFAALELARERRSAERPAAPDHAIRLAVRWRGPRASRMPPVVWLAPHGAYADHRFSPLPRGTWCYLTANLPHPSAALLEATSRICR